MVDCTGFENRQARKGLGGSNPSLSATSNPITHFSPEWGMRMDLHDIVSLAVGLPGLARVGPLAFPIQGAFICGFEVAERRGDLGASATP